VKCAYDPHRTPVLRFNEAVARCRELLEKATRTQLTKDKAAELAAHLESEQPWLEWAGKAIPESHRKSEKEAPPVTADSIRQWFIEAEQSQVSDRQEVPPRVRVDTRRSEKTYVFDTCDHAFNDAVLHSNLVTK